MRAKEFGRRQAKEPANQRRPTKPVVSESSMASANPLKSGFMRRAPRLSRIKHLNQVLVISRKVDKSKPLGWANVILVPGLVAAVAAVSFLVSWFFVAEFSVKLGLSFNLGQYFDPIDYVQIHPLWAAVLIVLGVLVLEAFAMNPTVVSWIAKSFMRSNPKGIYLFLGSFLTIILPIIFAGTMADVAASGIAMQVYRRFFERENRLPYKASSSFN